MFALIAILGFVIFPAIMAMLGAPIIVTAALGTFAAAALANAIVLRIYERAQLAVVHGLLLEQHPDLNFISWLAAAA